MPKFRVLAKQTTYHAVIVEAQDINDVWDQLWQIDCEEFAECKTEGEWDIDNIKLAKDWQINAYPHFSMEEA